MMLGEYDNIEAIEDELYCEDSSSETSIDSEVEFHLYSQVHYAQDLEDINGQEETKETVPVKKQNSVSKHDQGSNFIIISDSENHISDSPDIITLSDTPDEESIYKSKLQKPTTSAESSNFSEPISSKPPRDPSHVTQNSKKQATSRREKKANQKSISFHRDGIHMIHKILVIEDSSNDDADDVTSIPSESDNLEKWMLLGGDKDDRDDDILLNLEGCGTSSGEEEDGTGWAIGNKDLEAQIGNYVAVRRHNRYYMPDKNVTCRNCDKRGHLSKNCPTPKKIPPCCLCAERGHLQNSCPARFCLNCCLPGHCSRECLERTYWKKHCNRCDMRGHYADACPEIWRQYHLTTKPGPLKKANSSSDHSPSVYCYNCARKGHYGYECTERRMFGGTFPTFPFIYYYDNEDDMKWHTQRAKKRVQELQEAGLLPEVLKQPQTDDDQKGHIHKRKRKMLKERDKRSDKHHKKLKRRCHADSPKERKHGKEAFGNYNIEEDFPRGGDVNTFKKSRKTSTHFNFGLSGNRGKTELFPSSLRSGRKQKRKRKEKQRNYTSNSPTRGDNLFLIKQRKKKSKEKFSS